MRLSRRRIAALGLLAAVVGVIALVAFRYVPIATDALEARTLARSVAAEVRALGPGDLDERTVADLRASIAELGERSDRLADVLATDPLVGVLRSIGPLADDLRGADALTAAAAELVVAADGALDLAERFVAIRAADAGDDSLLAGLVELMATSTGSLDGIAAALDRASTALDALPPTAMGELQEARMLIAEPLTRYRGVLDQVRELDDLLPGLAGWDRPRRYLVLAQNPAELRPNGGFIGTYGILVLDRGRLASMAFEDVYTLDNQPGMPYQEPPFALQDHLLGRASWELADSAWSPDFPTAAQDALRIYTVESGDADIDGVIAITTFALDRLLEVVGPVEVAGYDGVVVEPGEVTVQALLNTRGEAGSDRKAFLDALADEVLARLFATPADRWEDLLMVVEGIGAQRLALAWFPDPAEQALVASTPLGGALRTDPGDHVYAVDGNVSPSSKLNLVVDRATDLVVELAADGTAHHAITLTWTNRADATDPVTTALREASEGGGDRYGTYTRVLVPADAELLDAVGESGETFSGVEGIDDEAGRLAFGNYLSISPGTASLSYTWLTPGVVDMDGTDGRYRLTIQKQPGMRAEALRIRIVAPDGSVIRTASEGMTVSGAEALLETSLVEDLTLEVTFGAP